MIVRLTLQPIPRRQQPIPSLPEQANRRTLIALLRVPTKKEVPVIGHQAINGADDIVTYQRMAERLP